MISLKKRKGKFYGEFFLQFLEEDRFVVLCHTNEMHLGSILPVRKDLEQIDFQFKFLKRKVVLNFFDKFHQYDAVKNVLNGSLAVIYPNNKEKINMTIFDVLKNQKKMILLGFYFNQFYLIQKGQQIFDIFKNVGEKDLATLTAGYKCSAVLNILRSYLDQIRYYSQIPTLLVYLNGAVVGIQPDDSISR